MRVYELSGLGDAVWFKDSEIPEMLKTLKEYFDEWVPPTGDSIEIRAMDIREQDFVRNPEPPKTG